MATELGSALRKARLAKGLTLRDVEKLTGMSESQISQIENGRRRDPAFKTVVTLAKALGLSLDSLGGIDTNRSSQPELSRHAITTIERSLKDANAVVSRLGQLLSESDVSPATTAVKKHEK
jgi:transcriptional regulator with XRE-family HTH domain